MDHAFFYALAKQRLCHTVDAARSIRSNALKKDGSATNLADSNLLPTIETLRRSSGAGVFTANKILGLLRCKCPLCWEKRSRTDPVFDERLSRQIFEDAEQLKLFALLCLTGCLFMVRTLLENNYRRLEDLRYMEHGDNTKLKDVFEAYQDKFGSCPRSRERHHDHRDFPHCLMQGFSECVRGTIWLFKIRKIGLGSNIIYLKEDSKENLPFIHESQASEPRDQREFIKCQIAPGYCDEASEELNDGFLFRKRMKFDNTSKRLAQGDEERSILSFINDIKHESIAALLFTVREAYDNATYITLVFRWYPSDLDKILYGKTSPDDPAVSIANLSIREGSALLDHPLWKSILGIVDAIANIHNIPSANVPLGVDESTIGGHFDIKPANILVEPAKPHDRLLLTDFGQAHIKRYRNGESSAFTAHKGTFPYSPPPISSEKLFRSYDAWSIGCVLLEVLLFLAFNGQSTVTKFYNERYREDKVDPSASFWTTGSDRRPKRRDSVNRRIQQLLERTELGIEPIVKEIQKMLSIDEKSRPPVKQSLIVLKGESQPNLTTFTHPNQTQVMKEKLQQMDTSISMENSRGYTGCNLHLWRSLEHREESDEIKLMISLERDNHSENTLAQSDFFVPTSNFDQYATFSASVQPEHMTKCKFAKLHRSTTFHFHRARDFVDFQAIMTSQLLCGPKDARAARSTFQGARFTSCMIHTQGFWGEKIQFSAGRAQIWRRLSQSEYERRYEKSIESSHSPKTSSGSSFEAAGALSSASSSGVPSGWNILPRPDSGLYQSRDRRGRTFKLVLFMFDQSQQVSIFMHLEPDDYDMEFPSDAPLRVILKRPPSGYQRFFRMAFFGSTSKVPIANSCAGVPLAPAVLNEAIDEGVKVKECVLTMESEEGRRQLQEIYQAYIPSRNSS